MQISRKYDPKASLQQQGELGAICHFMMVLLVVHYSTDVYPATTYRSTSVARESYQHINVKYTFVRIKYLRLRKIEHKEGPPKMSSSRSQSAGKRSQLGPRLYAF